MATAAEPAEQEAGILTPEYMASLRTLCTWTRPTLEQVSDIFNQEFRDVLGLGITQPLVPAEPPASPEPSIPIDAPSTSRGRTPRSSRKRVTQKFTARRGRSQGRSRKWSIAEEPEDESANEGDTTSGAADVVTKVGEDYGRSCTWEPKEKRCWLFDKLDRWNTLLATGLLQLVEFRWGEFRLQGYAAIDLTPTPLEHVLRVSLLVHLLLKTHRCIQRVEVDLAVTKLEEPVFWDALYGCPGVRDHFEFCGHHTFYFREEEPEESVRWAQSIATLTGLRSLTLGNILLSPEAAEILGNYVEESISLTTLNLKHFEPADGIIPFLRHLAFNISVTSMEVTIEMLENEEGLVFADVVRTHVALNKLEIHGSKVATPSALMRAAVGSRSLKTFILNECNLAVLDLAIMSRALYRRPPSPVSFPGGASASEPPTSGLENLMFYKCGKEEDRMLEVAFAELIRGGLRLLSIRECYLRDTFAGHAAYLLQMDRRLQHLYIQNNCLGPLGSRMMLKGLAANSTLEVLGLDLAHHQHLIAVFAVMWQYNLASRLVVHWINPLGRQYAIARTSCTSSTAYLNLSWRWPQDLQLLLNTLGQCHRTKQAEIEFRPLPPPDYVLLLALALENMQYIRILELFLTIPEHHVVRVFRGLEKNRTIQRLTITHTRFTKEAVKALARVVALNTTLTVLKIELLHCGGNHWYQLKDICYGIREAMQINYFIIDLSVCVASENRASDYHIKEALRRNMVLVNEAIRFIYGWRGKTQALAFDALRYAGSLKFALEDYYGAEEDEYRVLIRDALQHLAANFIFYAGIVKSKLQCYPHTEEGRRGERTIDILDPEILTYMFRYLRLSDIVNP